MSNRLAGETSPYLLQHAENPVDWWPWGPEALEEARRTGRPILLSIGYAACHWCHVMAHESFEDDDTAAVMNRLFVNIKVDREERPDVDQIYMSALHALGQQGGWPLTMFLTPDGEPFWGGTYFPRQARYGMPAFTDVLEAVAGTFARDRNRIDQNRRALVAHLEERSRTRSGASPHPDLIAAATARLAGLMDQRNGGLRGAPKFPQPNLLDLLFVQAARVKDERFAAHAVFALDRMNQGGIYDHVGGGYARYSVDDRWLVPHFEKMLYDNGQLLGLLARAWRLTGEDLFRRRIVETVDWAVSRMRMPGGAFAASLDADTDGEEGLTYVWTEAEIDGLLEADAELFKSIYDVGPAGNWEGHTILNRLDSGPLRDPVTEATLSACVDRLLVARDRRPQPGLDDKILADWNGYMIRGLAEAAVALGRADWLDHAVAAYRFVMTEMVGPDGRLAHATRDGRFVRPGFATDHAAMAMAAVALHQATFDPGYVDDAERLLGILDAYYATGDGLSYLTASDAQALLVRPLPLADEATPNHHGIILQASVAVHLLTGRDVHLQRADRLLASVGPSLGENILGAASVLVGFARRIDLSTVVVIGPAGAARDDLVAAARANRPDAILFVSESTGELEDSHPAAGKTGVDGRPAAYVCHAGSCGLPITDPTGIAPK